MVKLRFSICEENKEKCGTLDLEFLQDKDFEAMSPTNYAAGPEQRFRIRAGGGSQLDNSTFFFVASPLS